MSNETLFYVLGIALVLAALGISFLGVRSKDFPPRQVLIGATALFAAIVIGSAFYSVLNAEDEQEHREAELASEEVEAEQEVDQAKEGEKAPPEPAAATELALTSPEDGSLSFSPDGLEAPAGDLTIRSSCPIRRQRIEITVLTAVGRSQVSDHASTHSAVSAGG